MNEIDKQLHGLMVAAEEHNRMASEAIEGLMAQTKALAKERETLAMVVPTVEAAIKQGVGPALVKHLAEVSQQANAGLMQAVKPVVDQLQGAANATAKAEAKIRDAGKWFGWQIMALAVVVIAGLFLVTWAAIALSTSQMRSERDALAAEVEQSRAALAVLYAKSGGRAVTSTCGPQKRTCVRIDANAGAFGEGGADYRVIHGY